LTPPHLQSKCDDVPTKGLIAQSGKHIPRALKTTDGVSHHNHFRVQLRYVQHGTVYITDHFILPFQDQKMPRLARQVARHSRSRRGKQSKVDPDQPKKQESRLHVLRAYGKIVIPVHGLQVVGDGRAPGGANLSSTSW
jgi:hypothetical protein